MRWMTASSPISASARVRRLMRPEQWEGTPMRRSPPSSFTRQPAAAMLRAVREPAGPAPTTATSQSYLSVKGCLLGQAQPLRPYREGRDERHHQEQHDVGDAVGHTDAHYRPRPAHYPAVDEGDGQDKGDVCG